MTKTTNPHSKPMVDFNRDNAHKINTLCSPLKQHFGISAFGYLRAFDNGSYILISNNDAFLEAVAGQDCCFRSNYFAMQADLFCKYEPCVDIWPDEVDDEAINLYRTRGLHNGMTIAKEIDGSIEACWFSDNQEHSAMKDFYRKHSSVLDDFINHFRNLSGTLTDPNGPAKLGISPYLTRTYPDIGKIFKTSTPWERDIQEFSYSMNSLVSTEIYEIAKRYSLSPRELQCLSYVVSGYTVKEIARILNISPRTVETYLSSVRLKTECHGRRELTDWFQETFKSFLRRSYTEHFLSHRSQ